LTYNGTILGHHIEHDRPRRQAGIGGALDAETHDETMASPIFVQTLSRIGSTLDHRLLRDHSSLPRLCSANTVSNTSALIV
jgi:hypothetical protein